MSSKLFVLVGVGVFVATQFARHGMEAVWTIFGIGAALLGLGLLVFVHELGHFLGGKLTGMAMPSFQVGFGKPIYSKLIGETEWNLCPIPLGGAVRFVGEDAEETGDVRKLAQEPGREGLLDDRRWFHNASAGAQLLTLFLGPAFSVLFAIPLLFVCFAVWGVADPNSPAIVDSVAPGYPAEKAGIRAYDRIRRIGAVDVHSAADARAAVKAAGAGTKRVELERDGKVVALDVDLLKKADGAVIGVAFQVAKKPISVVESSGLAISEATSATIAQARGLYAILTGQMSLRMVSGPVGVITISGESAKKGPAEYLTILAMITIGLGITNLLPIPVLDGGRMVLTAMRAVVGRRIAKLYEVPTLIAGLAVILLLFIAATMNDILSFYM